MWLQNYLRKKFIIFFWLCTVAIPGAALNWIGEHPEQVPDFLRWVFLPVFLGYVASSLYICLDASRRMDEDPELTFWAAMKCSCAHFRQLLRFIPIVGTLFEPDEDKTHYDPKDD